MSATKRPLINAHRVDLTSLRILLAVAQTGSITQAAEQCHLALGAASTRMKELEPRLGDELLERHARGVRLTEAGRKLAKRSKHRHDIVYKFLLALGVSPKTAAIDTEGIEHHVSPETLKRFEEFTAQALAK